MSDDSLHCELKRVGKAVSDKILNKRRKKDTALVTKNYLIQQPFKVSFEVIDNMLHFEIGQEGENNHFKVDCNRVILSKFRPNQITFATFSEDVWQRERNIAFITPAYLKILDSFPAGCLPFGSQDLYDKVRRIDGSQQAHARRRWKELKYDYGFDVDFDFKETLYWRGKSNVPIKDPQLRPDDGKIREAFLQKIAQTSIDEDGVPVCNYCGIRVNFPQNPPYDGEADDRGLLDHRRPIFQGGDDTLENLQIFCQTCNNKKNSNCNNCHNKYKCEQCYWAFPEKYTDGRFVLYLKSDVVSKLKKKFGTNLNEEIESAIEKLADEISLF